MSTSVLQNDTVNYFVFILTIILHPTSIPTITVPTPPVMSTSPYPMTTVWNIKNTIFVLKYSS